MYSAQQYRDRTEIEKSIGKTFKPGIVTMGAKRLQFTEITVNGESRYSDAKIVAEGEIETISYTPTRSI
jgi:hypothetical protein